MLKCRGKGYSFVYFISLMWLIKLRFGRNPLRSSTQHLYHETLMFTKYVTNQTLSVDKKLFGDTLFEISRSSYLVFTYFVRALCFLLFQATENERK